MNVVNETMKLHIDDPSRLMWDFPTLTVLGYEVCQNFVTLQCGVMILCGRFSEGWLTSDGKTFGRVDALS